MKILIVEDQPELLETLRDILEFNGHEVLAAEDGLEGVRLAAQRPEFIFCDVSMPRLDGRGVLAAIKQMPEVRDVPFVFLTAHAERGSQRDGMSLGADDYITKPYTERDILEAIAARSVRHRSVHEKIEQLSERHERQVHAHWSHELLTPLNAVMGSVDLLESDFESMKPAEVRELLSFIRAGARRQEQLARKLIRYFGLEQMAHDPARTAQLVCAVEPAVQAAAEKAAGARDRKTSFDVSVSPGAVRLADEMLRDAVHEVICNAADFSRHESMVRVRGYADGGNYRIEITDEGPGLTAEQCARIGAFTQFDRGKREQQGLGLGLAIAQSTAKLAGGHLLVQPRPVGLEVVFVLPIVRDRPLPL